MWWFVFGCVTLLHFQNAKTQHSDHQFPGRYATRGAYAGYLRNPSYGAVYPSNTGTRPVYQRTVTGVIYPTNSALGGVNHGSIATRRVYPNYDATRVRYQTNFVVYPNTISSGVMNPSFNVIRGAYPNFASGGIYPSNIASGEVYPNNVAAGAAYPNNVAAGAAYPNNVATGATYPSSGATATAYPSNTYAGVTYPNNVATIVVYPSSGAESYQNNQDTRLAYPNNTTDSGSSNSNTVKYPFSIGSSTSTPPTQMQKIRVDVYYETNCPDSMRFITSQLNPAYKDLKDILTIRLIPFGKGQAFYDANSKKYEFQCHHGPSECYGNTVQGCSISLYPDTATHLSFIDCMESYPRPSNSGPKCARRLSLDWKSISKCAEGEEGKQILYRNAELTKAQQPPVTFVPWININGVHTNEIQRRSLRDFKSVVCEANTVRHPKC